MIGDSITLADVVPANHVYTKLGVDKSGADYNNQSAAAGSTDALIVRQTIEKSGKRRAVVRFDHIVAKTDAIPNPTKTSVYVVFEHTPTETGTQLSCINLATIVKNFLASADAAKVIKGEV